jgi:hypothetical protein
MSGWRSDLLFLRHEFDKVGPPFNELWFARIDHNAGYVSHAWQAVARIDARATLPLVACCRPRRGRQRDAGALFGEPQSLRLFKSLADRAFRVLWSAASSCPDSAPPMPDQADYAYCWIRFLAALDAPGGLPLCLATRHVA